MKEELHIYLRVSSEIQLKDGYGLEDQQKLGEKVSKSLGMIPIFHNEGFLSTHSQSFEDRPILSELMFKINCGDVKHLWVFNTDRLNRDDEDDLVWNIIRLTLRKNEVTLYVGEGTQYNLKNFTDDFLFGIMSEVSKYDNRLRTERLRRGRLTSVKDGKWKGGPPPYGYRLEDKYLVKDDTEMKWVKKIYQKYSNGETIYQIQKYLLSNGVESRRGKIVWSDQSIKSVLKNTHFEGYYYYTDKKLGETVRSQCPKTLPSTLVKKVRDRISSNTYTSNYIKTPTLLKDYLRCGHCGSKMGQRINKKQYYNDYYCVGTTKKKVTVGLTEERVCKTENGRVRSIKIEDTDELIWNTIVEIVSNLNQPTPLV